LYYVYLFIYLYLYHNFQELEEYCFDFFLKNQTAVMQTERFKQLDINIKLKFMIKTNNFFRSIFNI